MVKMTVRLVIALLLVSHLVAANASALQIGYDDGTFEGWEWRHPNEANVVQYSLPGGESYSLDSVDIYFGMLPETLMPNPLYVVAYDEDFNRILPDTFFDVSYVAPGWYSYDVPDVLVSDTFYVGFHRADDVTHSFLGYSFTDPSSASGHSYLFTGLATPDPSDDLQLQNIYSDFGIRANVTPNAVPEPSTVILLGSGLLGLLGLHRRRRA